MLTNMLAQPPRSKASLDYLLKLYSHTTGMVLNSILLISEFRGTFSGLLKLIMFSLKNNAELR